jgi:hypothetical protein
MAVRYPPAYLRLALLKPSKGYKRHLTTHQRYADSNGKVIYAPFLNKDLNYCRWLLSGIILGRCTITTSTIRSLRRFSASWIAGYFSGSGLSLSS